MERRIGLAGDWHGNLLWAESRIRLFAEAGITTIYQLGDFGLRPGPTGKKFLYRIDAECERSGVRLFVVLGNHEDYDRVTTMRRDNEGWLFLKDYPRLRFAPRGHIWVDEAGTRFAALGGAGSIDRNLRRPGLSWWPGEELTDDDCTRLVHNVRAQAWPRVDVMLTHDAPAGLRRLGVPSRPVWLTPEVEAYCDAQRVRLRAAMDQVAPRTLAHGHWHTAFRDGWDGVTPEGVEYRCAVFGLAMDGIMANAVTASTVPGVGLVDVDMLAPLTPRVNRP